MAMSKVEVVSNAIALLGLAPISSFDNAIPIVATAEQAFDFLYGVEISRAQWRFTCKIVTLNQLVNPPPNPNWRYAYQLPHDFEKLIRQYPHNYAYEIYENRVMYSNIAPSSGELSNGDTFTLPQIEYQRQVDYGYVPNYFWGYFVFEIAKYLSLANAHTVQYNPVLDAECLKRYGQALAADAQNRPQVPIISAPIITSRALGGFDGPISTVD